MVLLGMHCTFAILVLQSATELELDSFVRSRELALECYYSVEHYYRELGQFA
jgi:hypothetical protein